MSVSNRNHDSLKRKFDSLVKTPMIEEGFEKYRNKGADQAATRAFTSMRKAEKKLETIDDFPVHIDSSYVFKKPSYNQERKISILITNSCRNIKWLQDCKKQ